MPRPRAVDSSETRTERKRREIIEAATDQFLSNGFSGTSMDEIAIVAGVSKQTMYKQFSNKQTLFIEVVSQIVDQAGDAVHQETLRLDTNGDVETELRKLARRQLALVMTPRILQLRRLVISEADRFPALGQAFFDQGPGRTISSLAEALRILGERGDLSIEDAHIAAAHFNWLVMSIPLNRVMFLGNRAMPTPEDLDGFADEGVRTFLRAFSSN